MVAENPVEERRLAAILAADVVGYSKMMGEDEAGTLSLVRSLRSELIEPKIVEHKGRLFKTMGDGFLAEFPSVVNAVACAVVIQKVMTGRNTDLPDDRQIQLRIGVHLGDVIAEAGDVYGDGVNVAARIEGLAPAGGVAISGMVHDNIGSRLDVAFEDIGDKQLKNIARPVRVYCMAIGPLPTVQTKQPERTKPSIAVLPFTNMSGDAEQEYFSDGITEDIITELSRFRMLSVIARNSSFQYRDKAVDVRRVKSELGAQYVVEGSVRKMGDRVRITAQLIDADTGSHIWSERYDRSIGELFDVQDEVIRTIVSTITGRLEDTEISRASRRGTESVEAHDLFLRGIAEFRSHADGANQRARELFEQAIAVDPTFAAAHAEYSSALLVENGFEKTPQEIKEKALHHGLLAIRLDPRDSRCHSSLGWAYRFFGEFELAVSHMEQGLKLNPNDAGTLADMASVLVIVGRAEEGVVAMKKAMELNPYHPDWYWPNLAMTLFAVGRYEESLAASAKLGRGKKPWTLAREAACFAQLGRMEEARRAVSEVLRLQPDFRIIAELPSYQRPQDKAHVLDAMKKAGLPE